MVTMDESGTNIDLNSAKKLLLKMDKANLRPKSFFWYLLNNSWRLIISSDRYKNHSSKENYRDFINEFKEDENIKKIGLENITLLEPDNDLIKILRTVIKTDEKSVSEIRFKSNTVNNYYVDDAFIFRLT